MNVICLGARVIGYALARDLIQMFLNARFRCNERFLRRLNKVSALGKKETL